MANLVDNAVKYSPAAGIVRVEVERDQRTVTVTVRDEGPGIPPEQVPQLFTRFFRGDPARPRTEGSGLGLAIAKGFIEAMGARLSLDDTPGGGLTLTISTLDFVRPCEARK